MSVVAGVDVGNATTEVVLVSGGTIIESGRVPTRGRKGSADSLRAAAALVRRPERQTGRAVTEIRIAPLRAVGISLVTVPEVTPVMSGLRLLVAGVPTPGSTGTCVDRLLPLPTSESLDSDGPVVALIQEHVGYERAAGRCSAPVTVASRRLCSPRSFT